jgi:hypothetical protein
MSRTSDTPFEHVLYSFLPRRPARPASDDRPLVARDIERHASTLYALLEAKGETLQTDARALSREFRLAKRGMQCMGGPFDHGLVSWMVMATLQGKIVEFARTSRGLRWFDRIRASETISLLVLWGAWKHGANDPDAYLQYFTADIANLQCSFIRSIHERHKLLAKRGAEQRASKYLRIKTDMQKLARRNAPPSGRWKSRRQAVNALLDLYVGHEEFDRLGMSPLQAPVTLDKYLAEMEDADTLFAGKRSMLTS